ncbi:MAG TPA: hypothetical protein VGC42_16510 [Kofleriaceae bacterium]
MPGFVGVAVHRSLDQRFVVNYVQCAASRRSVPSSGATVGFDRALDRGPRR